MRSIRRKTARAASLALVLLIAAGPAGCGREANDESGERAPVTAKPPGAARPQDEVRRHEDASGDRSAEAHGEPSREGSASPADRSGPASSADRSSPEAAVRGGDGRSHGGDAPSGESHRAPAGANEPGAEPTGRDDDSGAEAERPEANDPAGAAGAEDRDEPREAGAGPNEP